MKNKLAILLVILVLSFNLAPFYISHAQIDFSKGERFSVTYNYFQMSGDSNYKHYGAMSIKDYSSEVAVYISNYSGSKGIYFVSRNSFKTDGYVNSDVGNVLDHEEVSKSYTFYGDDYSKRKTFQYVTVYGTTYQSTDFEIDGSDLYVFDDFDSLVAYFYEGDSSGAIYDPEDRVSYNSDVLYLNNVKPDFRKSKTRSQCYLDVNYVIPPDLKALINSGHNVVLLSSEYIDCSQSGVIMSWQESLGVTASGYGVHSFKRENIKLPLKNVVFTENKRFYPSSLADNDLSWKLVTGVPFGLIGDFNFYGYSLNGQFGVDYSRYIVKFTIFDETTNTYGKSYTFSYDIITGNAYSFDSVPDSSGTYTDSDTTQHGYLDVVESSTPSGVPDYTQVYHPVNGTPYVTDGTQNSSGAYVPVNVNVGGSQVNFPSNITISDGDPPVNIEDDDLKPDGIIEAIKDGYGLIDQTDTPEDDDGIISLIGKIFDNIDPSLIIMIKYGMGTVVTVAIIRAILKR